MSWLIPYQWWNKLARANLMVENVGNEKWLLSKEGKLRNADNSLCWSLEQIIKVLVLIDHQPATANNYKVNCSFLLLSGPVIKFKCNFRPNRHPDIEFHLHSLNSLNSGHNSYLRADKKSRCHKTLINIAYEVKAENIVRWIIQFQITIFSKICHGLKKYRKDGQRVKIDLKENVMNSP